MRSSVVLHAFDQRVDGLQAEAVVLAPVEGVGLVDEQHPPKADWIAFWVRGAVWPTYWPTRSARVTSTSWPPCSTPMAFKYRETMRATVVFPVPGLPVKNHVHRGGIRLCPQGPAPGGAAGS